MGTTDHSTGTATEASSARPTIGRSIDASSSMLSMLPLRARLNRLIRRQARGRVRVARTRLVRRGHRNKFLKYDYPRRRGSIT
jgi:hypothetical protein